MKVLIGIGILQLVITGVLLFKVVSLEAYLDDPKATPSVGAELRSSVPTAVAIASNDTEADSLSIDEIRRVVRGELQNVLSLNSDSPVTTNEIQESDPQLISEFESSIDYYLNDGAFSRLDLQDMEDKLIKLAPADRRKMMNKLSKAMSKANIQLIE